jgi:hypothetical protein
MIGDGLIETVRSGGGRGRTVVYRLKKPHSANGDLANGDSGDVETPFPNDSTLLTKNRNESSLNDEFEQFWNAYPRKVGKAAARKAFAKARVRNDAPTIADLLSAVARYAATITDLKYCAHPTTWLTQERWHDDLGTVAAARVTIVDNRPQRVKDAESFAAAHWLTGGTEQQLVDSIRHYEPDAREAAIAFYRSKGQRR